MLQTNVLYSEHCRYPSYRHIHDSFYITFAFILIPSIINELCILKRALFLKY